MKSREIEEYKKGLPLSKRQKEILIGLILGDGHLEKLYTPILGRLKVEHSYKQKDYVDWIYEEFRNWVRSKPKAKKKKVWNKIYQNFGVSSSTRKDKKGEQIYLGGKSAEKFIEIIKPYIIPSMEYKIPRVLRLTKLPKR